MNFKAELALQADFFQAELEKYMQQSESISPEITKVMSYSLCGGGKRIRPILMHAVSALFSPAAAEVVVPFACALEMIHTYSLIHDDLPAMDNSDLRRGRPTSHKVFGEAMAVLAGDALLNLAFETALSAKTDAAITVRALRVLAECSGIHGMIGGQVINILSEGKAIDLPLLNELQEKKTAALLASACVCGAIIGGAAESDIENMRKFAIYLGLAFQIKDDILDVEGDAQALGKPTGNDEACQKNTYVSLMGLDAAKEKLSEYTEKAREIMLSYGEKAAFLLALTDYLLHREN